MNDAWYTSTLIQHAIVKSDGFPLSYFYSRFLYVAINIVVMKIKFSTTLKTKPFGSLILKLRLWFLIKANILLFAVVEKKSVPNSRKNRIYFVIFWCCFKLCSSSYSLYEGISRMQIILLLNHLSSTQHTCTCALQTCSRQKANFTLFLHIASSILITKRHPSIVADAATR